MQKLTQDQINRHQKIIELEASLTPLLAKINVPGKTLATLGGGFAGYVLGDNTANKLLLAASLALLGSRVGKELTEAQKLEIQKEIASIKSRIAKLKGVQDKKQIMSASELNNLKFDTYPFTGKWKALIGEPSKNFHAIIHGEPKSGKSIFALRFAGYLSRNFGNTMYFASEEGYGVTLSKKIKDWIPGEPKKLFFSEAKDYETIRNHIRRCSFVFIDSLNYARITDKQMEELRSSNPNTAFIAIMQATKTGNFKGSQEFAHNADLIIEVKKGVAYQEGRFQAASQMNVFDN